MIDIIFLYFILLIIFIQVVFFSLKSNGAF